ncbi:MAG: CotH kinase family protein [Lachnospiraceae bacterium]|nr:CotH kinase family protein [Lachnospiraceae bacterium]
MNKLKQGGGLLLLCAILAYQSASTKPVYAKSHPNMATDRNNPILCAQEITEAIEPKDFVPSSVPAPEFSLEAGFYEEEVTLSLTAPKDFSIYVTTDGSLPKPDNPSAFLYTKPLPLTDLRTSDDVTKAWVIRAASFSPEKEGSDIVTKSYFIGNGMTERYQVPVVSLVTDPDNLYSEEDGIFLHYFTPGGEWERLFHFEYFTPQGECAVSINCGGRVHSGTNYETEVKPLRFYARASYDTQTDFEYDFFTDGTLPALDQNGQTIKKFKHLLLQGGGNELTSWDRTYFRDTLSAWCMRDTGLDVQASSPLVAFLNGDYYGIMNLRELQDGNYIEEHYGLDGTQVAIFEPLYDSEGQIYFETYADNDELARQSNQHFWTAFQFATNADLSDEENYKMVCEAFDIENYIDYLCIELFCGNTDWPGNNCKAWFYTGDENDLPGSDGRIRWLLYGTDFGFGLYGKPPSEDNITALLSSSSKVWPNPHGSTKLFRNLIKNKNFYNAFLSRMLDLLNENFNPDSINSQVDIMAGYYKDLIGELLRSGDWFDNYEDNIAAMKDYIRERPEYFYLFMQEHFGLGTRYFLQIDFDPSMGSLTVGTLDVCTGANCMGEDGFFGYYYSRIPVHVTATPADGYRFVGFTGDGLSFLTTENGVPIDQAQGMDGLLYYKGQDENNTALFMQDRVSVQNLGAQEQVHFKAVFEKEDASPSYLEKIGIAANIPTGSGNGDDTDSRKEGDTGTDGTHSGTQENSGTDGTYSDTQGEENSKKQNGTEFLLLCILLAITLGLVTYLGIRSSKKRFRH